MNLADSMIKSSVVLVVVACVLCVGRGQEIAEETGVPEYDRAAVLQYVDTWGESKAAKAKVGPKEVHAMMEEMLRATGPRKVRLLVSLERAIVSLSLPNELKTEVSAAILKMLSDEDPVVRSAAIDSLVTLKPEGASEYWLAMLGDPVERLRISALNKLAFYGGNDVSPKIESFLTKRLDGLKQTERQRDLTVKYAKRALRVLEARNGGRSAKDAVEAEIIKEAAERRRQR